MERTEAVHLFSHLYCRVEDALEGELSTLASIIAPLNAPSWMNEEFLVLIANINARIDEYFIFHFLSECYYLYDLLNSKILEITIVYTTCLIMIPLSIHFLTYLDCL